MEINNYYIIYGRLASYNYSLVPVRRDWLHNIFILRTGSAATFSDFSLNQRLRDVFSDSAVAVAFLAIL